MNVVRQLLDLGVEPGGVLLVHTSFRSIRPIEGGPDGLIAALREAVGPEGTLVMPSWTSDDHAVFDRTRTPAAPDLGIVAVRFWQMPGVERSDHPFAFAAAGPRAEEILRDPLPIPPHVPASPVGRVRDADGQVLLLGVEHDADTTIHLAELEAVVPYRRRKSITIERAGRPFRLEYGENDHCCEKFRLVGDWLDQEGLQSTGPIGSGTGRLSRSTDVVRVVVDRLTQDPMTFLHPRGSSCRQCQEAWHSTTESGSTPDVERGG